MQWVVGGGGGGGREGVESLESHFAAKGPMQRYYFRTTDTEAESKCAFGKPNKKELRYKNIWGCVFWNPIQAGKPICC